MKYYKMQSRQCIRKQQTNNTTKTTPMTKKSFFNTCKGSSITEKTINVTHHINRLMEKKGLPFQKL